MKTLPQCYRDEVASGASGQQRGAEPVATEWLAVTVTAEVSKVITDRSFVLTGEEYGDDSLLVLSAPGIEAERGEEVTVTGVVGKFAYGAYFNDYDLGSADSYEDFDAEEFLVATGGGPGTDPSPSK
ncbi:hypothetical protein [Actinoplanes sp. NPDC049316]|uniref:hypothetical protein n=1 Tax=Actinoplanes sp. NPDC049316 TaxID=3154727 RepID=UPI00343CADD0